MEILPRCRRIHSLQAIKEVLARVSFTTVLQQSLKSGRETKREGVVMAAYVFVGHRFTREFEDDFRRAIESAFEAHGERLEAKYADLELVAGHILTAKIEPMIDGAFFCIFDLSEGGTPNVFIEVGYALGQSKHIALTSRGSQLPSNIAGFDTLTYVTFAELSDKLSRYLPGVIRKAKAHNKNVKESRGGARVIDKETAWSLIQLDLSALEAIFYRLIEENLLRIEKNAGSYKFEDLRVIVEGAIHKARLMLQGYRCLDVGSITKFLQQYFPDDELFTLLREEIHPVFVSTGFETRDKRLELQRRVGLAMEKVSKRYYEELFGDDEDNTTE